MFQSAFKIGKLNLLTKSKGSPSLFFTWLINNSCQLKLNMQQKKSRISPPSSESATLGADLFEGWLELLWQDFLSTIPISLFLFLSETGTCLSQSKGNNVSHLLDEHCHLLVDQPLHPSFAETKVPDGSSGWQDRRGGKQRMMMWKRRMMSTRMWMWAKTRMKMSKWPEGPQRESSLLLPSFPLTENHARSNLPEIPINWGMYVVCTK